MTTHRRRASWSSESTSIIDDLGLNASEVAQISSVREHDRWIRQQIEEHPAAPYESLANLRITELSHGEDWSVAFSTGKRVSLRQWHEFHRQLKELFWIEAGECNGHQRIIPHFPKKLFWLSPTCSRERAADWLIEYLRGLLSLPPNVRQSRLFVDFFTLTFGSEDGVYVELIFEDLSLDENSNEENATCESDGVKIDDAECSIDSILSFNSRARFVYCIEKETCDAIIVEDVEELSWALEHGIRRFFTQAIGE